MLHFIAEYSPGSGTQFLVLLIIALLTLYAVMTFSMSCVSARDSRLILGVTDAVSVPGILIPIIVLLPTLFTLL